jgi:hypothetical protein
MRLDKDSIIPSGANCIYTQVQLFHGAPAMPTISMFYGIIICLYFFDDERQKLPHIHAKYQGQEASFSILDASVLNGTLPISKTRLVQAWIEIHRESLLADWELAVNGQTPFAIEPLR